MLDLDNYTMKNCVTTGQEINISGKNNTCKTSNAKQVNLQNMQTKKMALLHIKYR